MIFVFPYFIRSGAETQHCLLGSHASLPFKCWSAMLRSWAYSACHKYMARGAPVRYGGLWDGGDPLQTRRRWWDTRGGAFRCDLSSVRSFTKCFLAWSRGCSRELCCHALRVCDMAYSHTHAQYAIECGFLHKKSDGPVKSVVRGPFCSAMRQLYSIYYLDDLSCIPLSYCADRQLRCVIEEGWHFSEPSPDTVEVRRL